MKTLAFDAQMGASGDMLLGALLALDADRATLEPIERALDISYAVESVVTSGIESVRVTVERDGTPVEGTGPNRTLDEVTEIVKALDLPKQTIESATACFRQLAEAEARIHGERVDEIHFHEVGADDAIADITGVCRLLEDLDLDRIQTTPVATGGGTVRMNHGEYPIPGPAVIELAEQASWRIVGGPVAAELLTPTGAAILAVHAEGVAWLPPIDVQSVGYGAGRRTFENRPNVLRAILGHTTGPLTRENITVLETTLDDVTPEVLGGLQERLASVGALDVSVGPLTMKKARPGHLVTVVTKPADAERVATALARETGTLGVRSTGTTHRWVAAREIRPTTVTVDNEDYQIDVKVATDADGVVYDISAEFDDAATIASRSGVPIRDIQHRAESNVRRALDSEN